MERASLNGMSRAAGSASGAIGGREPQVHRRTVSGVGRTVASLEEVRMPPGDDPRHDLVLSRLMSVLSSGDPNFDRVQVHEVTFSDCVAGNGTHRGYDVNIHPGGDKTFTVHDGVTKTISIAGEAPQTIFEGTWFCTGGSGRFAGITGWGTYSGRLTPAGPAYTFEGEYEIGSDPGRPLHSLTGAVRS